MRPFTDISGADLRWIKPARRKHEFELRAGDDLLATLVFGRRSSAVATWANGQYNFSRQGWFRQRVLVHEGSDATSVLQDHPLATFLPRPAALTFSDGRAYQWKPPKRWSKERVWLDASATEVARFSPGKGQTLVTLPAQPAAISPDLPLLLPLAHYLFVLAQQDEIAAIAATTVVFTGS